ncbi:MarR family winged helix-turn-helix transcriptional regulator [Micrococcoides hystricis]|uniref:MarR family winged helix-turn-helix transcriptional regulator n=1 Tax=Micrococcoides hystricis TaxID=1572761 RepID=A0ABV6PBQ7_9MICC
MSSNALLQDAWRQYFETSAALTNAVDEHLQESSGLSVGDYNILLALVEAPEHRLRMGELAERIIFSASRLSYRIRRHEDREWVSIVPDAADGRSRWVQLMPEGKRVFLRAAKLHSVFVREHFMNLLSEDDAETLVRIFQRIELGLTS